MPVFISMLRAVNLGAVNKVPMAQLRTTYELLGFRKVETYVQSGNVVFEADESAEEAVAVRIEEAIESSFGFRTPVILRSVEELRRVIAANPFAGREEIMPNRLLVTFLAGDPGQAAREKVRQIKVSPEELHILGRELYVYYPDGMGRSKLQMKGIEKALNTPGTGRNWNSVVKLFEIGQRVEGSVEV